LDGVPPWQPLGASPARRWHAIMGVRAAGDCGGGLAAAVRVGVATGSGSVDVAAEAVRLVGVSASGRDGPSRGVMITLPADDADDGRPRDDPGGVCSTQRGLLLAGAAAAAAAG